MTYLKSGSLKRTVMTSLVLSTREEHNVNTHITRITDWNIYIVTVTSTYYPWTIMVEVMKG